jgi:2-hydroxy-6-oxonona-2,4-dienedioate hydrolase
MACPSRKARLDNRLARKEVLERFETNFDANPKRFPDAGHRVSEINAPTLFISGP